MKPDDLNTPKGEVLDIPAGGIDYIDPLALDGAGRVAMQPAAFWHGLPPLHLRLWAGLRARYGIPTAELCGWLRLRIGDRKALEIGAGCGDLGRLIGVPMTDDYQQQENKLTVDFLKRFRQEPTKPPPDVEKEDAESAVRRRKPQVVIGCWITQRHDGTGDGSGNMFGPREDYILERCETYIHIGNVNVHGGKRLLRLPHETHCFDWLVSRAKEPAKNVIHVWDNPRPRR